ncbi:probable inactive leucine-rich repeat receptor-like protein kinase At3g03770 [Vigna unguiculata]|uniref:Protein brassinosteroid insensitive 1 n=1 Tax=Vigna unguiculata TaxID=3917 RepID=A0A4D6M8U3_VIGUN|nr:probable inactive leucine-rich repeat receptor-like protein kinase At3g03770 [Vigna unguiculata]XP_027936655.1 probable inactive leucine-rich repeat receptor-like protein kinase At3g03770 [Vigna unguiculata]XP_027936664.1 probable inactive leucine-rich repeat receptor-like protein kinase At3g03770 [Vigna unguiculata]QCD97233.1 protein brassinosteroid insensitive 1 [Vigna unguiculata]
MANIHHPSVFLVLLTFVLSICYSEQLQSSHSQTLLRIQQQLNFPAALSNWNNDTDFCSTDSNSSLSVVCYEDTITQLHIIGERRDSPLPRNFSINSFVTTLVRLPSLKVLTLVSLGIWGPLPSKIARLSSLEIVNMSSNFLYGSIPQELSSLKNLQTLIFDNNMLAETFPPWLDSLPALTVLSLKNNMLNGSLPNSLGNVENLRALSLSHNHLYGVLPDFSRLKNLQVLELDDNAFGPEFPQLGNKLVTLVLRNNRFRDGIPAELISYYQLEHLDISSNSFVGPFQPALLSLPSITYLNISGNKLTGMLFENLSCNSELDVVDLSSNLLTGNLPKCLVSNSSDSTFLYARNCLDSANQNQQAQPFCHTEALAVGILPERKKHRQVSKVVLSLGIVGGTLGGVALVLLIFFIVRRGNARTKMKNPPTRLISENAASGYTSKLLSDARYISQTKKLGAVGLPTYRSFSLEEIEAATNYFDTASLMGEDSYGRMYRGQLKNGSVVAIRCVEMKKKYSTQNFVNHIELISKLRHRHLVSAIGHCFECSLDDSSVNKVFLVFEYVPNGTLRNWISDENAKKCLSWTQRIGAAIGVAKGIQFLHTGIVPGVYSNDLKIEDVLMDQNLVAKISSYHLPLLSNMGKVRHGSSSSGLKHSSNNKSVKHEDKSDIYDLGVILLELILGRQIKTANDADAFRDLLQASLGADEEGRRSVVDAAIRKACLDQSLKTMMEICVRCMVKEAEDRPSIEDVLWNLQFASQVQDAWRGDSQSSEGSPNSESRGLPFQ